MEGKNNGICNKSKSLILSHIIDHEHHQYQQQDQQTITHHLQYQHIRINHQYRNILQLVDIHKIVTHHPLHRIHPLQIVNNGHFRHIQHLNVPHQHQQNEPSKTHQILEQHKSQKVKRSDNQRRIRSGFYPFNIFNKNIVPIKEMMINLLIEVWDEQKIQMNVVRVLQ